MSDGSWMSMEGLKVQHKHIHVLHLSDIFSVYVTRSLTQTLLLFLSLGSGKNITLSETFILLMGHEHSHTEVYVIPTLMGTSKGCFQIISSKLQPVSITRALVSWGSSQLSCLRFLWLRGTDLHYLSVQLHSSHPGNLMEHSKFRLLWVFWDSTSTFTVPYYILPVKRENVQLLPQGIVSTWSNPWKWNWCILM